MRAAERLKMEYLREEVKKIDAERDLILAQVYRPLRLLKIESWLLALSNRYEDEANALERGPS